MAINNLLYVHRLWRNVTWLLLFFNAISCCINMHHCFGVFCFTLIMPINGFIRRGTCTIMLRHSPSNGSLQCSTRFKNNTARFAECFFLYLNAGRQLLAQ
uniref:Uncharacterized protein n=1 Tax=Rhipicephalus microplus TaxID=6941 RepID=A0A6M2D9V0_RHIMP